VETDIKYEGYIKKELDKVKEFQEYESLEIPHDIDYGKIPHLSREGREKLEKVRPYTFGQAMRITGVNAGDLTVLLYYLREKYGRK